MVSPRRNKHMYSKGQLSMWCAIPAIGKVTSVHIAAVTNEVSLATSEMSLDSAFLDTVGCSSEKQWTSTVLLQKKEVSFKLDTGAEVTAISEETFRILPEMVLKPPNKKLFGPTHQPLAVIGEFRGKLSVGPNTYEGDIFVIRGLKNNLLGLPAIAGLQLVQRLCATDTELDVKKQFPTVFNGLGTFGDEYTIRLKDDAVPHALYTPRSVPIPLREKVKEELEHMESMGVNTMVCGHGGGAQKVRQGEDLCGLKTTEQECHEGNTPYS